MKKIAKKKKEAIPHRIKRLVWYKYIGQKYGNGKCQCCGVTEITQLEFHCGHVKSEKCGGKMTVENMRPICSSCNLSMGTKNMNDFIKEHGLQKKKREWSKTILASISGMVGLGSGVLWCNKDIILSVLR